MDKSLLPSNVKFLETPLQLTAKESHSALATGCSQNINLLGSYYSDLVFCLGSKPNIFKILKCRWRCPRYGDIDENELNEQIKLAWQRNADKEFIAAIREYQ